MKKRLLAGVFAVALAATVGTYSASVSAQNTQTWTVMIHFEYSNGSTLDYKLASGVSTSRMASFLENCGRSHWTRDVVKYYCYPIPE